MAARIPDANWKSSQNSLGMLAIVLTVVAWAIAANVANSLFLVGVQPFELAGQVRRSQLLDLPFWIVLSGDRTLNQSIPNNLHWDSF
ncbi:MAG: hypothetical protein HC847_04160 [Hydrococcus sp. RU_2_2]|nr:hypothetical protein [Hydrococcus sp. RU_2_2]NJP20074.1 hypothetical protein [Hydrococcus sp. CRU_1_1]